MSEKIRKEIEEETGNPPAGYSKDGHVGEAMGKLVELGFDTKDEKLSQLTNIPLNQVLPLSMTETMEEAVRMMESMIRGDEGKPKPKPKLLSETFRIAYYKHRRSVRGDHLMKLATLAESQLAEEEERAEMPEDF